MYKFYIRDVYLSAARSLVYRHDLPHLHDGNEFIVKVPTTIKLCLDDLVGVFSALHAWSYKIDIDKTHHIKARKSVSNLLKLLELV